MNRKYWSYFVIVQFLGLLGGYESLGLLQDGVLWLPSLLLLLPGSLVFLPWMLAPALPPVWLLYFATVAANALLFYLALRLVKRRNAKLAALPHVS
jgi:hypothetical protein